MSADPPRLRTLKSLGQHFLADKGIARRIVAAADVVPGDRVLEIGPGRGILTQQLLDAGASVTAVELDRGLYEALAQQYAGEPRLTLLHADALKTDPAVAGGNPPAGYKVVANLPYQVTTPLLFHFLEAIPPPSAIVVMIQKEVAERILATPGGKIYGVLSLGVQAQARAKMCFKVLPGAFRPPPKVTSAVVRVDPFPAATAPVP
ncbi:MAG: 16S rRNA (adenine(1518)-N(6)/adenine(1519)-N(6))-dimethyltransferase RsmA, partial [Nitrospirota bacterium]|nr:16S rRNA (adenine(1518)-N(6)/adenine(1519)-N(6))-dimethyltransferase RsmA [Nitrospirota bacterium]